MGLTIRLVTSWDVPTGCGIEEHSRMLIQAVEDGTGGEILFHPDAAALDPARLVGAEPFDVLHLNCQAALHSRWEPSHIQYWQQQGKPVVVTWHDTMSGAEDQPNSPKCRALAKVADAFIVHEPVADLPWANYHYWRQGVLDPPAMECEANVWRRYQHRPVVGSMGFPFPWKNYDLLCASAFEAGWAVLLLAANATDDQIIKWQQLNPHTTVKRAFMPRDEAVCWLRQCDATAFLYLCANTGTSGAIRMGIAARKPLLATHPDACRQFRDLQNVGLESGSGIRWLEDLSPEAVTTALALRTQPGVHNMDRLAEQDSWRRLGGKYADLYRSLVA